MLSKKQAKAFFLGGTILFSVVFLGLSYDTTFLKVGEQTHEENLTEEVAAGKAIYDENNCMGCHTLLGEGAYYAPELTKVYDRRGPEWIRVFIKDPQKMFPNERKMVQYDFTEEEISELIAFFKWIGEMDLNGFPAEPDDLGLSGTAPTSKALPSIAQPKAFAICAACHAVGGKGGNVGPALDGVGSKFDRAYLTKWIKDPQSLKPGTTMPQLDLSDAEFSAVIDYLNNLK